MLPSDNVRCGIMVLLCGHVQNRLRVLVRTWVERRLNGPNVKDAGPIMRFGVLSEIDALMVAKLATTTNVIEYGSFTYDASKDA